MDKIKTVKIKLPDGSVSEETYTISVDAKDVDMKNGKDLQDTIGDINVDRDGSIAEQLGKYKDYDSDIETLYGDVDDLEAADTELENDIIDLQINKINKNDIVDNLESTSATKVLSANQGKVLGDAVAALDTDIKKKAYFFDTVAAMKAANLHEGDYVCTLGYYTVNDGGGAEYRITSTESQTDYQEELNNSLYATLIIKDSMSIKVFGGIGNGQTSNLNVFLNINKTNVKTILMDDGDYLLDGTITFSKNLIGKDTTLTMNRSNEDEFCFIIKGNDIKIENITFHSISSNKFVDMLDSNNVVISNCNFTSGPNRTKGGPLDLYRNNKNILIQNCFFETHTSGSGGIWVRQGSSSGISDNIEFNNCMFIGDSIDETIAIWGWKGTIQNVKVINSSITRPTNQNVSNAFPITIGQSGITKNCGFINCEFNIYQANAGVFHVCYDNDVNLYVKDSIVNTYMESVTNGVIMMTSDNENFTIENCIINQLNTTGNISCSNSLAGKYKNCTFNCATQIKIGRGNFDNCIFNNNPLVSISSNIARQLYAKNCIFNNINNTASQLIQCLNTNDSVKIEDCTFNYITSPERFIFATGDAYSTTLPLIIKNSIFKGLLYINSNNISKGYVIGNYIDNNIEGYISENIIHENNTINFNY